MRVQAASGGNLFCGFSVHRDAGFAARVPGRFVQPTLLDEQGLATSGAPNNHSVLMVFAKQPLFYTIIRILHYKTNQYWQSLRGTI